MGILIEGFNGLVEIEKQYGDTTEGVVLIDGVLSDTLDLITWPFRIDFINLSMDRAKVDTFVAAIRVRIQTYLNPPEEPPA